MVVAHVYKDCFPPVAGGIEKHIHSIRNGGSRHRHDVIVCNRMMRSATIDTEWGKETRVAEFGRPLASPLAPGMAAAIRESEADLFHFHMPHPTGEVAALLICRKPFVCTYHCDIVRQVFALPVYSRVLRPMFRRARAVVVGSLGLKFRSPVLRHLDRTVHIPYGVDTDALRSSTVSRQAVEELRQRYGGPFVLAVGRLVYYKGFDVLIRASRNLPVPMVIIGEGPLRAQLEALSREIRPDGGIHLRGAVEESELLAHYAAASVFALPSTSRAESFGLATAEAQSFGLPAVVSDVGTGTTEAISPGVSGLVVPPGEPTALAAAIREILRRDERGAVGAAARAFAEERLSAETMISRLDRLYESSAPW